MTMAKPAEPPRKTPFNFLVTYQIVVTTRGNWWVRWVLSPELILPVYGPAPNPDECHGWYNRRVAEWAAMR